MQIIKIYNNSITGLINVRYKMENMEFDAAIDFDHMLHYYDNIERQYVPIELYNCSEDWDIYMVYPHYSRQQMHEFVAAGITGTPLETLIESETQQWIDTDPESDDEIDEDDWDPYEDAMMSLRRSIDIPEDVDPTPVPGEPEYGHLKAVEEQLQRERDFVPSPQDDFYQYLDRYGSDAFTVAIVEMLRSGELPVTWE